MDIDTMKEIFKQEGWTMQRLKRRQGKKYIYARKRGKKHLYIAPETKIEQWSEERIRNKLREAS